LAPPVSFHPALELNMLKWILPTFPVAVVAMVATFAIAEEKAPTTKPAPVNVNCAVMQDHKADPDVTFDHKGKLYAFCCSGCIDDFKKDPDKYAANAK
jgi:YHS domain-containing protein